jgi:hypothetical protein
VTAQLPKLLRTKRCSADLKSRYGFSSQQHRDSSIAGSNQLCDLQGAEQTRLALIVLCLLVMLACAVLCSSAVLCCVVLCRAVLQYKEWLDAGGVPKRIRDGKPEGPRAF